MNDTAKISNWFETKTRPETIAGNNDKTFVTFKDGAPDWLKAVVRECHNGLLPSNWVFEECRAICEEWDCDRFDGDESARADALHEYSDSRVDIYTSDLFDWAAKFCTSSIFSEAEEKAKDFGAESFGVGTIERLLRVVQYCALETLAYTMLDAIRENMNVEAEE